MLKQLFINAGIYERLKYSWMFRLYQTLFKPEVKKAAEKELNFYSSFLSKGDLVFDIGANDGHKTEAFLQLANKVVCCEPDAKNFKTLQIRFRNKRNRVMLEQKALGAQEGILPMFVHHEGSAFNTLNPKFKEVTEADDVERWNEKINFGETLEVPVTTLDNLIAQHGIPFFIKIDVEGYELQVLKGLSKPVACLSIECLFPEFREELEESLAIINNLDEDAQFNVSVHDELLFVHFVNLSYLRSFLQTFAGPHFELVVKMGVSYD